MRKNNDAKSVQNPFLDCRDAMCRGVGGQGKGKKMRMWKCRVFLERFYAFVEKQGEGNMASLKFIL